MRGTQGGGGEDLPTVDLLNLRDADYSKLLSMTSIETEEELRKGDPTLSSMNPPRSSATGRRVCVELYDVHVMVDA